MILLKTTQGAVSCTKAEFTKLMTSKSFLGRGNLIRDGKVIQFFSESLKGREHIPLNKFISTKNLLIKKQKCDFGGGDFIHLNVSYKDVLDWYDFDSFIFLNAEKVFELIDDGTLKVYSGESK